MNRPRDVLEALLAEIGERHLQLIARTEARRRRDASSAASQPKTALRSTLEAPGPDVANAEGISDWIDRRLHAETRFDRFGGVEAFAIVQAAASEENADRHSGFGIPSGRHAGGRQPNQICGNERAYHPKRRNHVLCRRDVGYVWSRRFQRRRDIRLDRSASLRRDALRSLRRRRGIRHRAGGGQ